MRCDRTQQIDLADFATDREAERYAEFRSHYPTCDDCAAEVGRWLRLEQALDTLAEAPAAAQHPDEASLLAYARTPGQLSDEQIAPLSAHLEDCSPCRTEFAVLRDFDFDAIPSAGQAPAPRRTRSLWERMQEGIGTLVEDLSDWLPRPALAGAAAALVMLPLSWLAWQSLEGPGSSPSSQIAQVPAPSDSSILDAAEPAPTPGPAVLLAEAPEPSSTEESVASPVLEIAEIELAQATPQPAAQTVGPSPQTAETGELIVLEEPILIAALMPSSAILYATEPMGALAGHPVRTFGVVRSASQSSALELRALGPEHPGWTSQASPTLYWWLSEDTDLPLELTVADDTSIEPLVEVTLEGPHSAGIHALSLNDTGAELTPEILYRWQVALVTDPKRRSKDVRAGAAVVRHPPSQDDGLETAPIGELAHRYAALGYWYDAFATVSGWLDAEPEAENLRTSRRALLEQVGLHEVHNRRQP
ncbi:DUF928 domain-containing protein [Myxococcota bacterium]|nr:DUF928 domain-containing protein [Myxococcota bacterium]